MKGGVKIQNQRRQSQQKLTRGCFPVLGAADPEITFEQKQGWLRQPAKPYPAAAVGHVTVTHMLGLPNVFLHDDIDQCFFAFNYQRSVVRHTWRCATQIPRKEGSVLSSREVDRNTASS